MEPLYRIVLTGGPCAGKTTAITQVANHLRDLGFRVFIVPETPTMLFAGGASCAGAPIDQILVLESQMLRVQMAAEDAFVAIARAAGAPAVVLCDRGCMDVAAYVPPDLWRALLDEHGWTPVGLRDRRYDAVLHLVTAADGAEGFYTTENNATRTETPDQARAVDRRIRDAWLGHPHHRVIGNLDGDPSTGGSPRDFAAKLLHVLRAVRRVVGAPQPEGVARTFLVERAPDTLPVPSEVVETEQTHLWTTDGAEAWVRRRGQRGSHTYTHTVRRPLRAEQRIELARNISPRTYVALLADRHPDRLPVRLLRTCFIWKDQSFTLDRFESPLPGLLLLEVETDAHDSPVGLPPFLQVAREVTGEAAYGGGALARSSPPTAVIETTEA